MSDSDIDSIYQLKKQGKSLSEITKQYGSINKSCRQYLETIDAGTVTFEGVKDAQNGAALSAIKFSDGLKLAAKNMGVMLAVTLAIKAAMWIFDQLNVTFEEQQEKVDGLTSKLDDLNHQYEALNNRKTLSDSEKQQLEYLKSSIEYTEKQIQKEQELLAMKELYGKGDVFSNGNLSALTYSNGASQVSIADRDASEVDRTLEKLEKQSKVAKQTAEYINSLNDPRFNTANLYKDESKEIDKLITKREEMVAQRNEWIESRNLLQHWKDSGVLDGEELLRVEADLTAYDEAIASITDTIHKVTVYVDVVPQVSDSEVNSDQDLINQFGKNQVDTLSGDELNWAKKIENIEDYGKNITLLKEDISDLMQTTEEVEIEITVSDAISNLEKLKDTFDNLSNIYNDVKDGGEFDYGALVDPEFANQFADYADEYQNFVNVVSSSPKNISACQTAFNDLITAWLMGQEPMQNITEETKDLTAAWLKQVGVENAVEMADYALSESKKKAFIASHQLTEGTETEIQALLDEASAAGFSENAMYSLAVAIVTADDSQLTFEQQISAIYDIATAAGLATDALNNLITAAPADPSTIDFGSWSEAASKGQKALDAWYEAQQTKNQLTRVHDAFSNWLSQNKLEYKPTAKYGGSGSGGSGGGGGSASDPYSADIDKYKDLSDAVENCEVKITHINQALEHTDSVEAQIALNDKLIGVYKEQQDALTALNNARDQEIAQNVAKLRAKGFDVEYDPKSDNLKIKNIERLNQLAQDDIKTYETLINDTYDLNDANKEAAEQWTELSYSILDVNKQIKELQKQRYEDAVDDIDQMISLLEGSESTIGDTIPYYEKLMANAITRIKDLVKDGFEANKDDIKDLMSDWMSYYDARIENEIKIRDLQQEDKDSILSAINDLFDSELEKIDKEIEALNKSNEERKAALELQKAQAALDAAKSQKVRKVLRQDVGFVYEADEDAVKEAEEALADIRFEESISALEKQKETLEELQNKWAEIPDLFEKHQNKLLAEQELGANWEADILNDRKKAYEDFKDEYFNLQKEIYDLTEELNNKTNESYLQTMEVFKQMMNMYISAGNALVTTTSAHKAWYVNKDGKAPSQAQVGDIVYTKGGTYQITEKDENGKFTSQKINDTSTSIPEGLWGTEIKNNTADLTDVLGMNVLTNQDVIDSAKEHTDSILKSILGNEYLAKIIGENSHLTEDEVASMFENIDSLDGNSVTVDDNTVTIGKNTWAIEDLTYALNNLDLSVMQQVILEEEELVDVLSKFDDSTMSEADQAYVKELQKAWNTAKEQGNTELMDELHSLADWVRSEYINGNRTVDGLDYGRIGYDGYSKNFTENSRSNAYGNGAQVAGIIGTTKSIWGLDSTDKKQVQDFVNRGLLTEDEAKNLVQLAGGNYDSDGTKKSTYKGKDISGWDKQVISDRYSDSGETYWTKIKYTDPSTGQTVTKHEANAYTKEQIDNLRNSSKNVKENTNTVGENTDASNYSGDGSYYAGDAAYDLGDTAKEVGKTVVEGTQKAAETMAEAAVRMEAAAKASGGSYSSGGGGKGNSGTTKTYDHGAVTITQTTYKDGSIKNTVKDKSTGRVIATTTDKVKKKARGGINLKEDIYNVDELGAEMVISPEQGRYIRIERGGGVIPADVTKNLWEIGINPPAYIQQALGGLFQNLKLLRPANAGMSEIRNEYNIGTISLPNVHDANGFARDLPNLPNLAKQYMTRK